MLRGVERSGDAVGLIIHGHFYQPPRENPWVGVIERQGSARPHHDWNARIAAECYTPNAFARILDENGHIVSIVNNYELLSFNVGPTLMAWLETRAPATYARILEADRRSLERHGHGNAIAQAYNHAILPLMSERDRRTQLSWGIADFEARFSRRPEAVWLPETAVSEATLEALVEEGLRFVILSPHQAEAAREASGANGWTDVSTGSIDPSQPYRVFLPAGRSIDVFFYDGPISAAIGFQGALAWSSSLIDRLQGAVRADRARAQLIHVATDGESYGHHTPYGERTLAYALAVEAPRRGFAVTNYAAWLQAHPPVAEARLKPGPHGEGTAWSCSHGLGRWTRDCGCSTGTPGFQQAWRGPLRQALDLVRDRVSALYDQRAERLFHDPAQARDSWGRALTRPDEAAPLLDRLLVEPGDEDARLEARVLLEMVRWSQLMYTSCGWFFDELSGLEATQILRYAARAIERWESLSGEALEPAFLALLSDARSNLPDFGSGAEVYRELIAPSRVTARQLAAQEAMLASFGERPQSARLGEWEIVRASDRQGGDARFGLSTARVTTRWLPTDESATFQCAVVRLSEAEVCCAVAPFAGRAAEREAVQAAWRAFADHHLAQLLRAVERGFGPADFTLGGLLDEDRERVLAEVYRDLLSGVAAEFERLYEHHRHTLDLLRRAGLPLPAPLKHAAEAVLGARFEAEIARQKRSRDPARYKQALVLADDARARGLELERPEAVRALKAMMGELLDELRQRPDRERHDACLAFVQLARRLGIDVVTARAQEQLWAILAVQPDGSDHLQPLSRALGFAPPNGQAVNVATAPS